MINKMDILLSSPCFIKVPAKPEQYRYGTAGFRMQADLMPAAACRLGPVFVERAQQLGAASSSSSSSENNNNNNKKQIFGVMVTASHNPSADNGLKIVEPPFAHMLNGASEQRATDLARAHTESEFFKIAKGDVMIKDNVEKEKVPFAVIIGWDTRPSCQPIVEALKIGIEAFGGEVILAGQMVTPMLHWCVEKANEEKSSSDEDAKKDALTTTTSSSSTVSVPPLSLYLDERMACFSAAVQRDAKNRQSSSTVTSSSNNNKRNRHVVVDCANGVGTGLMKDLVARIGKDAELAKIVNYTFQLINTDTDDVSKLNHNCGADYVQKNRLLPEGFSNEQFAAIVQEKIKNEETDDVIFYSLDGDSDRIVAGFCDPSKNNEVSILEGDRFTALFATVLLQGYKTATDPDAKLSYGAVQTAYANGASTLYLRNLPVFDDEDHQQENNNDNNSNKKPRSSVLKTEFALTGVKHVHAAAEKYDLGLYFESNGHGTVLASKKASSSSSSLPPPGRTVVQLCSQSCGDAVANLLAAEYALLSLNMNTKQWCQNMYLDLNCVQKKVPVPDPTVFKCTPGDEQTLVKPDGAQEKINAAIKEVVGGDEKKGEGEKLMRAFVRPSGTEPVVRLYVEGRYEEDCKKLTVLLEEVVKSLIQ